MRLSIPRFVVLTLSYTMARRAYQEWLDVMPSNRILWGSDTGTAEGIYGATVFTRQCLAEALAEKSTTGRLAPSSPSHRSWTGSSAKNE